MCFSDVSSYVATLLLTGKFHHFVLKFGVCSVNYGTKQACTTPAEKIILDIPFLTTGARNGL
jgi:hypothetical protein